jgi:hypothetical protein
MPWEQSSDSSHKVEMRNYAANPPTPSPATSYPRQDQNSHNLRAIEPLELADWVEGRLERISRRWYQEMVRRDGLGDGALAQAMRDFLDLLVSFLPALVGSHRKQVESTWAQATQLFGTLAAQRGLAAGEVVEEFQILREAMIRLLYEDPPLGGRLPLSLREVLRLNRAIDKGVTHASVGHTDALFFSLFEGSGIPDTPPADELVAEVDAQVRAFRAELRETLGGRLPGEGFLTNGPEEG